MGGAVSAGRDNNDLIDNLVGSNYIRTIKVQKVFRAVDRADYILPEKRDDAYKDLAWKDGVLHLSAPCIYSEVMEALELCEGLSFLNLGSGTGYLSTMAGLLLGTRGINHGIEIHDSVIEYANKKLVEFKKNSPAIDEFDFCEPIFLKGNGLCLSPIIQYDRVYCGAGCPPQYENYLKTLIRVGGIVIAPMQDTLIQIKRINATEFKTKNLLSVTFAPLIMPSQEDGTNGSNPFEMAPASLQVLSRFAIRNELRKCLYREQPRLEEYPIRPIAKKSTSSRRICIPINPTGRGNARINMFDDYVDPEDAEEMNALLSLVLDMGHNRVAGALRFDNITPTESERDASSSSSDMSTPSETDCSSDDSDDDDNDMSPEVRLERAENDLAEVKGSLAELSRQEMENEGVEDGEFLAALRRITNLEKEIAKYKRIAKRNMSSSGETKEKQSTSLNSTLNDSEENEAESMNQNNEVTSPKTEKKAEKSNENDPETSPKAIKADGNGLETSPKAKKSDKNGVETSPKAVKSDRNGPETSPKAEIKSDGNDSDKTAQKDMEVDGNNSDKCMEKLDAEEAGTSNDVQKKKKLLKKERKRITLDNAFGVESTENSPTKPESEEKKVVQENENEEQTPTGTHASDNRPAKRTWHEDDFRFTNSENSSSEDNEEPIRPTKQKVKKISTPDVCDVRRNQISLLLKEKVCQLSLPLPLRVYVNLGRSFE